MTEPSDQSDGYLATSSLFNLCSSRYNEIENPTNMIHYPNYLPNYHHDPRSYPFLQLKVIEKFRNSHNLLIHTHHLTNVHR